METDQNSIPQEQSMVEQQPLPQETEQQAAEPTQKHDQQASTTAPELQQPQEKHNAANIRFLREKAEMADRYKQERDELLQYVQRQNPQYQQQPTPPKDSLGLGIGEDELAEGKHISKVAKRVEELEQQVLEAKLRAKYTDFDSVLSAENIKSLSTTYPEIAATLNADPNLYTKAASTYQMIKRLGIVADDPYAQERNIAQLNAAKPRPLTSVSPQQGDSPMSKANAFANGLTDDLRKQLLKEMAEARKNR
jgi:hypothetical protein